MTYDEQQGYGREHSPCRRRKSSYSQANGNCLEVADGMGTTLPVRDSKDTSRSPLAFSSASWTAFIEAVKENDSQL